MKKLIIFAGAMLLLAAGTVGFFANRPMSTQEALILKNVEAIASGEGTEKFWLRSKQAEPVENVVRKSTYALRSLWMQPVKSFRTVVN